MVHDARGDLIDDGERWILGYDIFNRLTQVWRRDAKAKDNRGVLFAKFRYNALGYRTSACYDLNLGDPGKDAEGVFFDDVIEWYAYDQQWRMVAVYRQQPKGKDKERPEPKLYEQFVYHAAGIGGHSMGGDLDAPLCRYRDLNNDGVIEVDAKDPDGAGGIGTDEVIYYLCDRVRGDVLAIADANGNALCSIRYSAYGVPYLLNKRLADFDNNGTVESGDYFSFLTAYFTPDPSADVNHDGYVNSQDFFDFLADFFGDDVDPAPIRGSCSPSWLDNHIGYCAGMSSGGYYYDQHLDLYHVRNRAYDPLKGRWLQRDPIGYAGGMNLYQYCRGDALSRVDPLGLHDTFDDNGTGGQDNPRDGPARPFGVGSGRDSKGVQFGRDFVAATDGFGETIAGVFDPDVTAFLAWMNRFGYVLVENWFNTPAVLAFLSDSLGDALAPAMYAYENWDSFSSEEKARIRGSIAALIVIELVTRKLVATLPSRVEEAVAVAGRKVHTPSPHGARPGPSCASSIIDTDWRNGTLHHSSMPEGLSHNKILCFAGGTLVWSQDGPVPIETVHPGDRVADCGTGGVANDPHPDTHDTSVDTALEGPGGPVACPEQWREIELSLPKERGSEDFIQIRLLRTVSWLRQQESWPDTLGCSGKAASERTPQTPESDNAQDMVGKRLHFVLPEMDAAGWGMVRSIKPCPVIARGSGRIVTATFRTPNQPLVEVRFVGQTDVIGCTPGHPFLSADRSMFVPAAELAVGERVASLSGTAVVESVELDPARLANSRATVYNFEVGGVHRYAVGVTGLVVHNAGPCKPSLRICQNINISSTTRR